MGLVPSSVIICASDSTTRSTILRITNLYKNNNNNKVKLILSCLMEKADLKGGEVIANEAVFHSKTKVNLESTISNELFSKIKETVLVSLAKFQRQESNL